MLPPNSGCSTFGFLFRRRHELVNRGHRYPNNRTIGTADATIGTLLTYVGIPGLAPLAWWQMLVIFTYALVACLFVNDALKVALIRWRIPAAVAGAKN